MMRCWFEETPAGRYAKSEEERFFAHSAARYAIGTTVQMGMPDWHLLQDHCVIRSGQDFEMNAERSAWLADSLDLLLMPHVLEHCHDYPAALAEAYRALKPEGRMVLTGLNPHSVWRLSGCFDGASLPEKVRCLPLHALKKSLKDTGFTVESGRFMVYRPAVGSEKVFRMFRFMEAAGDRWWPQAAAVYGLVLVKRQPGVHLLDEAAADAGEEMVLAPAACKGCSEG